MLILTVVDEAFEGAKTYKSYCRVGQTDEYQSVELTLTETEYDDAFSEALSREISAYTMHTVFTFDYESSSDAGNGNDDYYTEEKDLPLQPEACIIKDNQFFGALCEAFDCQGFVLLDFPETIINHPKNYGGRNYHFYRDQKFTLIKKI